MTTTIFLHGLDSSGRGTKGSYIAAHFPEVLCPDFSGSLQDRLDQLALLCTGKRDLVLIGSSFGGLMATCFALAHPGCVRRLILLAPALNFTEYAPPARPLDIPTLLVIGKDDTVTPPELVLPLAERTFAELTVELVDDDHLLHATFSTLPWPALIREE